MLLRVFPRVLLLVVLLHPLVAEQPVSASSKSFATDVVKMSAWPNLASGGVLMVDGSIFRLWETYAADLGPAPIRNRALGGSQTGD
jgi:hypothetical protein